MTLSHCWGGSCVLKLTTTNLETLRQGLPKRVLPKTFQHAFSVTRKLGCTLIWIESLCILQDSVQDWRKESSAMSDVYANAVCNIAATGSSNPHEGLFRDRDPLVVEPCIVQKNWKGEEIQYVVITNDTAYLDQITRAPLNHRAWVLQERLLSRRLLQFGHEQIFWECPCLIACEGQPCGIIDKPNLISDPVRRDESLLRHCVSKAKAEAGHIESSNDMDEQHFLDVWQHVAMIYTRCDLTRTSDKYVAISGVVDMLQHSWNDQYLAGVWKSQLPSAALWHRKIDTRRRPVYLHHSRKRSERAPSWSWASLDGPMNFRACSPNPQHSRANKLFATVISVEVDKEQTAVDHFTGFLRLDALLMQATFNTDADDQYGHLISDHMDIPMYAIEDTPFERTPISLHCALIDYRIIQNQGKNHCLYQGLLLQPREEQIGVFTRFGYFHVLHAYRDTSFEDLEYPCQFPDVVVKHFERKEITIH